MRQKQLLAFVLFAALGAALGQRASSHPETAAQAAYSQGDVEAMKADAQRMRNLITQMQNNLGNVGTTTMPLRHQFELEIEMWQVAAGDLERRIGEAERSHTSVERK